jgi:very-short-patch-repair endonuclease
VLGEDLTAASRFKPGDIVIWEPLPFEVVEDHLHRWRDIALNAIRVASNAQAAPNVTLTSLSDRLGALQRAWASDAALESHAETFRALDMALPTRGATEHGDALRHVRGALAYLGQFHERGLPRTLVEWLASGEPRERVSTLLQHVTTVSRAIEAAEAAEQAFATAAGVDARTWYGEWPKGAAFALRVARFDRAIDGAGTLARYAARLRARVRVMMGPIPAAAELLESGTVSSEQLPAVYDYLLARTLAEAVLRERPELDRFSGSVHETRRAQFAGLDERLIALTRQVIAQRANALPPVRGVGYGPVSELSEQSLIEHEIEKTRRHIPIREMFRRAGRAIQALKPCVMMGPQSVAQYLPPGLFHFDLVVMDEASQMRPEDALGAIARGAQLVVVGDPKQLGPTSFFDTVTSDEDEIEELAATLAAEAAAKEAPPSASVLERSESILLAAARRYPLRMLRWHYRSRYPELIAFSNHEFYGDGLVLFPHPGTEREGDGINFRAVDGAVYATSLNAREAGVIVEAVREHAARSPERTLMVVTMNQPQRELVDVLVQNAEKDDPALAAFRARHEGTLEPFAVKNLENVQGDERDTIFVGVTYGPNERGTLAQNFGPINATGGERRLNVLFTRAKFRLDVFCSFDPGMLRVSESSPRGLCVLRDYLRFAQEKNLETGRFTAREPGSDFEIEVSRALRAHGYEVHPQVGVAGYYLDLAVVDPNRPGRYVLGIECDGATYHSARSARDRDRLRQEVLQNLGWQIHRIWSTDWFRDPRGETARLVRRIEKLID